MKVLFLTREYPPFEVGGIAVHTYNLVKNISALGISCKVLSFGDENFSNDEVTFVNPSSSIIERKNVGLGLNARIPLDLLRFTRAADHILKNEKFDIIHVEEPYVGALVSSSGRQAKVSTFHTTSFGEIKAMIGHSLDGYGLKRVVFYSSLGFFLELKGITSSNSLIVPTKQIAAELSSVYGTSMDKVQIIENGVDLPELNKSVDSVNAKMKLGLSPDSVLILSVGRLVGRKHVELLLKAERLLNWKPQKSNQELLIESYGWYKEHRNEIINKVGMTHRVGWNFKLLNLIKNIF